MNKYKIDYEILTLEKLQKRLEKIESKRKESNAKKIQNN